MSADQAPLFSTGIPGLDEILGGGLSARRMYLIEGRPGTGKTTLCLQTLLAGRQSGEKGLYVTLSETRQELESVAASHGWSLEGITLWEPAVSGEDPAAPQGSMFHPSEVELDSITQAFLAEMERVKPQRMVIDTLSELRLLAGSALRHRRQIHALRRYANTHGCTMLLADDELSDSQGSYLHNLAHGVISLERISPDYGTMRRRLKVPKLRGVDYRGGWHDFVIRGGGMEVFARLVASDHVTPFKRQDLSSGVESLDRLLGGGLSVGTSTLVMGPAGAGKSTVCMQFMLAAAQRGQGAAAFLFDESARTWMTRAQSLGMDFASHVAEGRIRAHPIDPGLLSPGEFVRRVRNEVERDRLPTKVLIIDSLNGYMQSVPEEHFLRNHLHQLLAYLGQRGVVTLLVVAQHGFVGDPRAPLNTTYFADNVIVLRPFEANGEMRHSVAMIKKRTGDHERAIRELRLGATGIQIGEPLSEFQGILTGEPVFTGTLPASGKPR